MNLLTPHEMDVALRLDLSTFIHRTFLELNPGTPYRHSEYIDVIASKLRDCFLGRTRRLIINLPPRHTKSIAASVAFPAWVLGLNPSARIIACSYAQDLANKHSMDTRAVMESPWFKRAFRARLSRERNAMQEFTTTAKGSRLATSIGGVLTGRGGDFLIIDDPTKPEDAISDAMRKKANEWFDSTLYSQQNDRTTSCIILIMHRLHEDDLTGHVLEQEPWERISFPVIAEQDEAISYDTPLGPRTYRRSLGGILHPDRETPETLAQTRATIGEYHYAGQYMQAPAPLGGGLVKLVWLQRYSLDEKPASFDQIVCSWDTANKPTELADYSAGTVWGVKDGHAYLLHVVREKMNYPQLKRTVAQVAHEYRATTILIEDKAAGTQLIQELRQDGIHGVQAYEPRGDKLMRLHAQTATMESGFVHVPERAPWLAEYLHELTTFPGSRYDDQVDSTSQALEWIKCGQNNLGLLLYYREENARRRAAQGACQYG
ncbi:phage terminase large subunit [Dokdonella soli]|uniref:Phage terminase large subunit n=1 Tax=Dokdonella soli TaxID=529810 RepID=A0ABN1IDX7_9GAMM